MSWVKETLTINGVECGSMKEVAKYINDNNIGRATYISGAITLTYRSGLWLSLDMKQFFEMARYSITEIYQMSLNIAKLDGDPPEEKPEFDVYKAFWRIANENLKIYEIGLDIFVNEDDNSLTIYNIQSGLEVYTIRNDEDLEIFLKEYNT